MPEVTLGRFTEKDKQFIKDVRKGLVQKEKKVKDLAVRSGTSSKTVYERYKEPEKMTVKELRAYIRVAGVPKEKVINFLYEDS